MTDTIKNMNRSNKRLMHLRIFKYQLHLFKVMFKSLLKILLIVRDRKRRRLSVHIRHTLIQARWSTTNTCRIFQKKYRGLMEQRRQWHRRRNIKINNNQCILKLIHIHNKFHLQLAFLNQCILWEIYLKHLNIWDHQVREDNNSQCTPKIHQQMFKDQCIVKEESLKLLILMVRCHRHLTPLNILNHQCTLIKCHCPVLIWILKWEELHNLCILLVDKYLRRQIKASQANSQRSQCSSLNNRVHRTNPIYQVVKHHRNDQSINQLIKYHQAVLSRSSVSNLNMNLGPMSFQLVQPHQSLDLSKPNQWLHLNPMKHSFSKKETNKHKMKTRSSNKKKLKKMTPMRKQNGKRWNFLKNNGRIRTLMLLSMKLSEKSGVRFWLINLKVWIRIWLIIWRYTTNTLQMTHNIVKQL